MHVLRFREKKIMDEFFNPFIAICDYNRIPRARLSVTLVDFHTSFHLLVCTLWQLGNFEEMFLFILILNSIIYAVFFVGIIDVGTHISKRYQSVGTQNEIMLDLHSEMIEIRDNKVDFDHDDRSSNDIHACCVMVIVVGNGHGDTSSNPGGDWLHFT